MGRLYSVLQGNVPSASFATAAAIISLFLLSAGIVRAQQSTGTIRGRIPGFLGGNVRLLLIAPGSNEPIIESVPDA